MAAHARPRRAAAALIPLVLLAFWIVLKLMPYSDRASLYAGVSTLLEWFQHPVCAGVLCVAAAAVLVRARRARPAAQHAPARVSDVHVREEPGDRLAFLFPDSSSALGRDFVSARDAGEEAKLLSRLEELAARSAAFNSGEAGPRETEESRELQREIYSVGLSLADAVLGAGWDLRERLFELEGDHLLLRLTPGLAGIPWELLVPRAGAQFLWRQYHVARQVREDAPAAPPRPAARGTLRMLLLADLEAGSPGRSLPAAEAEANEIMELAALDPDRLRVVRRSPRTVEELRMAFGEGFDVIHFAGHTADDGGAGWVLGGGDVVDPASLVGRAAPPPFLLFANACRSGPGAGVSCWSAGAPARLMVAGVAAYVGTLWELEDARAAHFSRVFYRSLLSGRSLGEAMSAARESQTGVSPFTWANYALYGDPARRLFGRP